MVTTASDTRRTYYFEVPFVAGKARVRFFRGRAYRPAKDRDRGRAITSAWVRANGKDVAFPKGTPVQVDIDVFKPAPKGARDGSVAYVVKPDTDNIAKLVLDALNGYAYEDDSQVVWLLVSKHWRKRGQTERMRVLVSEAIDFDAVGKGAADASDE